MEKFQFVRMNDYSVFGSAANFMVVECIVHNTLPSSRRILKAGCSKPGDVAQRKSDRFASDRPRVRTPASPIGGEVIVLPFY